MNKLAVSVLILAKNEEKHIVDCIKSCAFASEIIVIDDGSTDKTVELAKSLGAKVIFHKMNGDWGAQRNFAIAQASCSWIFFVDADERCTEKLASEIEKILSTQSRDMYAYEITRKSIFKYNKASHGVLRPDHVVRCMPKEGAHVEGQVHEKITSKFPTKRLQGYLLHYTYDNWTQYYNKLNRYAELSAEKYKDKEKKVNFIGDIVFRPMWAFFKAYILDRGFLDGKIGFVLSSSHAFYTMQKYVRLYYLYKSDGKF